jgi:tRNA(Arg) A34 adenosine deaminase TadA
MPVSLEEPWRDCFELAWEAFGAGTIPVGAVVTDGSAQIAARGRNRIFEYSAPPRQIAGSWLAHAELNALAELPALRTVDGRSAFAGYTLYTTLEPCALCMGAALMMMVGELRFASADHYGGGRGLRLENAHTARLPLVVTGPLDGLLGDLGELLLLAHFVWRRPDGLVIATYRERRPDLVDVAERIDLMAAAQAGASLDEAIELVQRVHT